MVEVRAPLYNPDGESAGDVGLDGDMFGVEPNLDVLHQVVTAQLAAARAGTASTKTRGEVRGGGRKPWRQKGLGRARHGSIRSPQWVGGGVAHGPKPRDYTQRTPKKMKRLALRSALSARASEAAVKVVEDIDWPDPKTKRAVQLLEDIGAGGKTLLVLAQLDGAAARSFRNLRDVRLSAPGGLTPYDVLWSDQVVFTVSAARLVGGLAPDDSPEADAAEAVIDDAAEADAAEAVPDDPAETDSADGAAPDDPAEVDSAEAAVPEDDAEADSADGAAPDGPAEAEPAEAADDSTETDEKAEEAT